MGPLTLDPILLTAASRLVALRQGKVLLSLPRYGALGSNVKFPVCRWVEHSPTRLLVTLRMRPWVPVPAVV